jgi:AbrB family looped-hinge helix DNA binding protein
LWHNISMVTHVVEPAQDTHYIIALGARGRIVLPAPLREQLGLAAGDRLVVRVRSDRVLEIVSLRAQARRLRGMLKDVSLHRSLVDELIEDRRAAAHNEDIEWPST